jgi:hypothetical protein
MMRSRGDDGYALKAFLHLAWALVVLSLILVR